jgi:surface antigen
VFALTLMVGLGGLMGLPIEKVAATAATYANDYPYRNDPLASCSMGGPCEADPWAFYKRECTSYVAWRLNYELDQVNSSYNFHNNQDGIGALDWGNASNWNNAAATLGYAVNQTPKVGSVAQWDAGFGHVAYVEEVNSNGTVDISEYNWNNANGDYNYRENVTADNYIHFHDDLIDNSPAIQSSQQLSGDFDDDGQNDIVKITDDNGQNSIRVFLANTQGTAFDKADWALQDRAFSSNNRWFVGDYSDDGKDDLAMVYNQSGQNYVAVFVSTGTSFAHTDWIHNVGTFSSTDQWFSGDFTGDTVPDLARVFNQGGSASIAVLKSTTSAFSDSTWVTQNGAFAGKWIAADFTGGSKVDIAHIYTNASGNNTIRGFRSKGDGFVLKEWIANAGAAHTDDEWIVGRFTEDEKYDLAKIYTNANKNNITVLISIGEGFVLSGWSPLEGPAESTDRWYAGNFTNSQTATDLDDIAKIYSDGGQVYMKMFKSNGSMFVSEQWLNNEGPFTAGSDTWLVGKYSADALHDVAKVVKDGTDNSIRVMTSTGTAFNDSTWLLNEGPYASSNIWF